MNESPAKISPLEKKQIELKTRQAENAARRQRLADLRRREQSRLARTARSEAERIEAATAEIMDGAGAGSLLESMKSFETEGGDRILAGTDKGINYKDHNEDRVVISPQENFVAIIDGMGGYSKGDLAAQILAENISKNTGNIELAVSNSIDLMRGKGVGKGGAVFISAKLNDGPGGKFLDDIFQIGDCKLIVLKKNGEIRFESVDQSLLQTLVEVGAITEDEALYSTRRSITSTAVSPEIKEEERVIKTYPPVAVEEGDLVLLMSDGPADNFTTQEIANEKKEKNLSSDQLFAWISNESSERMRNIDKIKGKTDLEKTEVLAKRKMDGVYSDGYRSEPKKDNRALAIIEIKGKSVYAKEAEAIKKQYVAHSIVSLLGKDGKEQNYEIVETPNENNTNGEFVLKLISSGTEKNTFAEFEVEDFIKAVLNEEIKFVSAPPESKQDTLEIEEEKETTPEKPVMTKITDEEEQDTNVGAAAQPKHVKISGDFDRGATAENLWAEAADRVTDENIASTLEKVTPVVSTATEVTENQEEKSAAEIERLIEETTQRLAQIEQELAELQKENERETFEI